MPILAMFYGIVVRMYVFDNRRHHLAHVHAEYSGQEGVFAIATGELITGAMPPNKARLVQAWIEIHREDLLADWDLAINGEELFKIEPLK